MNIKHQYPWALGMYNLYFHLVYTNKAKVGTTLHIKIIFQANADYTSSQIIMSTAKDVNYTDLNIGSTNYQNNEHKSPTQRVFISNLKE